MSKPWSEWDTVGELYLEAIEHHAAPLLLYLDFLIYEKEVIKMDDKTLALDLYFADKHADRMNKLVGEYKTKLQSGVSNVSP